MALAGKQRDRGHIGADVDQLGTGRGVQEIVTQHAHQQEHQKTASARPEEAIVDAQRQPDQAGRQDLVAPAPARLMVRAQILACQRVEQDGDQHQRQRLAQQFGRHHGDGPGTHPGAGKACCGSRQHGPPRQRHAARKAPGGKAGAPDRGRLVGAQQGGRHRVGKGRKQCRQQDQPATTHDGIHAARKQRGDNHDKPVHRVLSGAETETAPRPGLSWQGVLTPRRLRSRRWDRCPCAPDS